MRRLSETGSGARPAVAHAEARGAPIRRQPRGPTPQLPLGAPRHVWAISCFYVARSRHGQGVIRALLPAAVAFARDRGARAVEGYPVDVADAGAIPAAEAYTGTLGLFLAQGFAVVEPRRSARRPVVRRDL